MDSLWLDVRHACRSLIARPGFTLLAILTLALGIGVNTVAFSAINALLLRPFRMADPDRVGWIMLTEPGNPRGAASLSDLDALTRATTAFESVAAESRLPVSLRTPTGGEQAWALLVTTNYLDTVGARPVRGRLFTEADVSGSELPAVITYRFWKDTLAAPASLAGQRIVVNGRSVVPVGVLPDDFQGIGGLYAPDMWLPLARADVLNVPPAFRTAATLTLFGRLRPGVTDAQAQAELTAVAGQLSKRTGGTTERTGRFYSVAEGHPEVDAIARGAWPAFGLVAVVLLIACFNVAALLMARAAARQKEIGVRSALGASRLRILRQLVVEGLILAAVSGAAALVVAAWSADLLATFSLPSPIPQRLHLDVDGTLLLFTALAVAIAGVLPALLPGLQATRVNLVRSMRNESAIGGGHSRTRSVFVVAQIAGSTVFVVAALLFARSFAKTLAVPTGFDEHHVVALRLSPATYGYDVGRSRALFEDLQARMADVPGVSHVSIADRAPFYVGFTNATPYSADGRCHGADCRQATVYRVGPGYFAALGVPLRSGRDFTDLELRTGSAVIVGERLAKELWPADAAIGQTLRLGDDRAQVVVIGVAAEYVHRNVSEPPGSYIYRPLASEQYAGELTVLLRTRDDPRHVMPLVRERVRALDPDLPVGAIETLAERMKMPQWMARTAAGFFLICATLALVLATIGLFGVMYFTVSQRTREFGIRVALGATRQRVIRVVLSEGLRLAVPGVALGLAGGYIVARILARALYGIGTADPVSFGGTATVQVVVALAACALPAYRATRADPIVALRQE